MRRQALTALGGAAALTLPWVVTYLSGMAHGLATGTVVLVS